MISDFESWTYLFAQGASAARSLSIDNMQIINRCTLHDPRSSQGTRPTSSSRKAFVKSKLPFCDHYLITTFFYPPSAQGPRPRSSRRSCAPRSSRRERRRGDHLLVYQTAEGNDALADTLAKTGLECRVYGMRRGIKEEQVEGNLRYRPFSEAGFIDDLASARAVIAGGGFTLMGEAVYLHKPMLAVPARGPVRAGAQRALPRARGLRRRRRTSTTRRR